MRCYNGCPNSEMQAALDDQEKAMQELAGVGARATYFPAEGMWMVFKDLMPVTEFHYTLREAANAALLKLRL